MIASLATPPAAMPQRMPGADVDNAEQQVCGAYMSASCAASTVYKNPPPLNQLSNPGSVQPTEVERVQARLKGIAKEVGGEDG